MSEPDESSSARRALARRVAVVYFLAAAGWIVLSDLALLSFDVDVGGIVGRSIGKGLLFCAVTALLLYFLLSRAATVDSPSVAPLALPVRHGGPLVVFAGIAVTVIALTGGMFLLDARHEEQDAREQLRTVLDLKVRLVEQWLANRREVARAFAGARALREQVSAVSTLDPPGAREALEERLEAIRSSLDIDAVLVFDARAKLAAGAGAQALRAPGSRLADQVRAAIAGDAGTPQFLHRERIDARGLALLDFVVPLRDLTRPGPASGALVLRDNASSRFFKIVGHWPTVSATAEALLVRQQRDRVIYLNDLRSADDATREYSLEVTTPRLIAAQALAGRDAAVAEGVDYRGEPVLAAWRPVAGSDWMMVVNISRDEVLAPVRRSAAIWLTAILAITAFAAYGVSSLWRERLALVALRERVSASDRRRAEDRLRASEERLRRYFEQGLVGMAISQSNKRFAEVNDKICKMLGYERDELVRMDWAAITHPEDLAADVAQFERVASGEIDGYTLDKRFLRKDGSVLDTTISVGCLRRPDRSIDYIVALLLDVTGRRRAEARIAKLARLRASASAVNRAIVHARDEHELYRAVCEIAVREAGFRLVWIGLPEAARGELVPEAWQGETSDFMARLRIPLRDAPGGNGPAGIAAREGHSVICNDFLADPSTAPWHARARERGVAASAAIPFPLPGGGYGVLAVYERETGRFDTEVIALLEEMALDLGFALKVIANGRELRESADRQRALLEQSIAGIYVLQDGKISYVNPRMREIFGYRSDEVFDPDPLTHIAPEERARIAAQIVGRMGDDRPGNYSITSLRKDGSRFTLGVNAHRVSIGGKYAIMAVAQDITEKARIEEERQARLQRYQVQIQALSQVSASEAIVEGDLERLAREITESACRAAGVERANVWLFNEEENALRCIDLYEATPARHSSGAVLMQAQFETEFKALRDAAYVNADDPLSDPRTAGYADGYLKPLGITSMLDAVICFSGSRLGLLCLEHVGRAHHWENDEISFACQLADKLAIAIVNRRRRKAQAARRDADFRLRRSLEDSIGAIAATVEMRDPYTSGHERRVAELATAIAREMGIAAGVVEGIHFGGLIHDLGKIQVPAEILAKPARLSPIEYELIKMHPQSGHDILRGIDFPWPVAQMVLQHHERMDGSGYPQRLKGDQIILEARILAVADVVEAMASHRPYRPGLGIEQALAEVERGRGIVYDAQVADACLGLFREKRYQLPA